MNIKLGITAVALAGMLACADGALAAGPQTDQPPSDSTAVDPATQPDPSSKPNADAVPYGGGDAASPGASQDTQKSPSAAPKSKKHGKWHKGSGDTTEPSSPNLPGSDNGTGSMKN